MSIRANLGFGGNLGDPAAAMALALKSLDQHKGCRILNVSRLYRTPPWGKTDQDWFFNAAAELETDLEPEALLDLCLEIERGMKRVRRERWGPRTLDIDILTYGDQVMSSERLKIPHPHMHERGFVLMPLCDFASDLKIAGKTAGEWLSAADTAGIEAVNDDRNWWK